MLQYNFTKIFYARGIEKPSPYLQKFGFSENFTRKIISGDVRALRLSSLEKLCLILQCTPNDVIEWIPDEGNEVDEKHPLNKIKKNNKVVNILKTLNSVPIDKLVKIEKIIKESLA